jgi:hypothetical protein
MADWATISSLATAGGTLVLATATFAAVRSSNRSARIAEQSLLEGLRPLLVPSRLEDPPQKVGFADGKRFSVSGSGGAAEVVDSAIYLVVSLRNVGNGIAVLHGWRFIPEFGRADQPPPLELFTRLTRDIYVAPGDIGFWQGSFRDPSTAEYAEAKAAIEARQACIVEVLYGDYQGGQRVVSRFGLSPVGDDRWLVAVGQHWNIDREDPR